jgi:hypothetical protein
VLREERIRAALRVGTGITSLPVVPCAHEGYQRGNPLLQALVVC